MWRVLHRDAAAVTVGLFTCGGEEVSRVTSGAPEVVAFLAGRDTSEGPTA